ncbi:cytochrome c oxidase assembly protein cox-16, mitochondrial [Pseudovirgaria hyperparasitica]|uniref:Cytochrome c oxidase assembly protein COX16, mitochondrial n=1 Tax=Pseudovirgaria hyperparasitica TaxID=470096 RepID=A0A6A6WJD0_9PEZI|nr:cytochrome c oxidase assembly protein cox-16, mitochondrial [Pseudovirgaria hyperparasitica]KAF2761421.1 cytochrome c oxidase assembly protein cox-16, mitochondrial [Pseudovirgaria hyperparasitica]
MPPRKPVEAPSGPVDAFFRKVGASYRRNLSRHPFALFGAPFVLTIVAGSFFLTPATALRYERHNRKVQALGVEGEKQYMQELEAKKNHKFDIREEYFKLAGRDLDNWEQVRVPRKEGDFDGVFK